MHMVSDQVWGENARRSYILSKDAINSFVSQHTCTVYIIGIAKVDATTGSKTFAFQRGACHDKCTYVEFFLFYVFIDVLAYIWAG